MRALIAFTLRHWPLLAFLTSIAMLAIAHAFETFGHLAPCTLCLDQRDVYWVAIPVCAAAWLAARGWGLLPRLAPWLGLAMAIVFATGVAIATYHAGAEWKFWPGPKTCSSVGGTIDAAGIANFLREAKVSAPRCDEAAWRFLGVSMAGWNALISLKLTIWSAVWALRRPAR